MKVPTLLIRLEQIRSGMNQMGKRQLCEALNNAYIFYSQGFRPEMLTGEGAIFDGWKSKIREFKEDDVIDSAKIIDFWFWGKYKSHKKYTISHSIYIRKRGRNKREVKTFYFNRETEKGGHSIDEIPQTLSQFISDCDRAGIPLKLSPFGVKMWEGK